MSISDDQEWENAVSKLQLNPPSLASEEDADLSIRPSAAPPMVIRTDKSDGNFVAVPQPQLDSPVDESLRTALLNPRERANVLYIEKFVYDFAQSGDNLYNVPPLANSFQRLLAYRIAQRFNIGHQTSDIFYANGERGITLFKTPSTFTPRTLLIDVWRVELAQQEALTAEAPLNVNRAAPQMEKGKKVKVMKRSTSGNSIDKSDKQTGKRAETLGDKEKAYEEARARIFGLETSPTAESSSVLPSCPDVSPPTNDISAKEQRQDLSPVLLVEETSRSVAVIDASAVTSKIEKLDEPVKKGGRRGKNVDTTSWTGNKSIARDKFAEQADPDFARNHRYVTPAPYTNQQYAPPNHFGAGYPMGMPYGPPHGFAEYGVPMSPQHGYHDPRYGYVNNNVYGPPSGYYPPAPRIAEGMQHDESYGGYSGRLPKAASLNRGPPPPDSSNFPPLG